MKKEKESPKARRPVIDFGNDPDDDPDEYDNYNYD